MSICFFSLNFPGHCDHKSRLVEVLRTIRLDFSTMLAYSLLGFQNRPFVDQVPCRFEISVVENKFTMESTHLNQSTYGFPSREIWNYLYLTLSFENIVAVDKCHPVVVFDHLLEIFIPWAMQ